MWTDNLENLTLAAHIDSERSKSEAANILQKLEESGWMSEYYKQKAQTKE